MRVSGREQNEERQIIAMRQFGIPEEEIFVEKQSGKDFNRPKYGRLFRMLREDDILVIESIDQMGRNYEEILEQWRVIYHALDEQSDHTRMEAVAEAWNRKYPGSMNR